jgi:hypothetical protein
MLILTAGCSDKLPPGIALITAPATSAGAKASTEDWMRRQLKSIARGILVFLLATQAVLAAVPCVSPGATAADAFVPMPADCEQAPPANLCLQHCIAGDQSSGHGAPPFPAPPVDVLLVLPVLQPGLPHARIYTGLPVTRTLGPPIQIRNLSLLL